MKKYEKQIKSLLLLIGVVSVVYFGFKPNEIKYSCDGLVYNIDTGYEEKANLYALFTVYGPFTFNKSDGNVSFETDKPYQTLGYANTLDITDTNIFISENGKSTGQLSKLSNSITIQVAGIDITSGYIFKGSCRI